MHHIRQVVGALVVAGAVAGGATAARDGSNLTLVAYSTPRAAYAQLIPAFQGTSAGKDVVLHAVLRSVGRPEPRRRSTASTRTSSCFRSTPTCSAWSSPGSSRPTGTRTATHGMVTDSVVVLCPARQPEAHQGLERPGQARCRRDHAEPVHLGRRPLERNGRLRRAAQGGKTPAQAEKYLVRLFKNVSVQDKSAREALQTFAAGKGDVLIGYENEAIFAKKNNVPPRVHGPGIDDPDREPDRSDQGRAFAGEGVRQLAAQPLPKRSGATTATRRSCRAC